MSKLFDLLKSILSEEELIEKKLMKDNKETSLVKSLHDKYLSNKIPKRNELNSDHIEYYKSFLDSVFNNKYKRIPYRVNRGNEMFTIKTTSTEAIIKLIELINNNYDFDKLVACAVKYYSKPDITTKTISNFLVDNAFISYYDDINDDDYYDFIANDRFR